MVFAESAASYTLFDPVSISLVVWHTSSQQLNETCRITATIIAPTPLVAANLCVFSASYSCLRSSGWVCSIILGRIIGKLGSRYSRLSPKWCTYIILYYAMSAFPYRLSSPIDTIIFSCCDLVSLVVQAVGGATASTAVSNNDDPENVGFLSVSAQSNTHPNFRGDTSC